MVMNLVTLQASVERTTPHGLSERVTVVTLLCSSCEGRREGGRPIGPCFCIPDADCREQLPSVAVQSLGRSIVAVEDRSWCFCAMPRGRQRNECFELPRSILLGHAVFPAAESPVLGPKPV